MRRILWRFDDNQQEPEIFVTTRLNYGDGLAGCIAIAAIHEAAEMLSKCREEAASFLKNMTYVDDASAVHMTKIMRSVYHKTWKA